MDSYQEFSDEHHPASLAEHYIAYRAQVRAKVACLRAGQGDARRRRGGRPTSCGCARTTWNGPGCASCSSAARRARARRPWPGSSATRPGWTVLRSDEVRKELAGVRVDADATARPGAGIYGPAPTEATYDELLPTGAAAVDAGRSQRRPRRVLGGPPAPGRAPAGSPDQAAADLVELQVDAPPAVAAARIAARRAAGGDASDATVDVAAHLRGRFDPWPEAVVVDTTRPLGECVRQALTQL